MTEAQHLGRSLRLFLVDGSPNGIVTAEIMNWTDHALAGPRSRLPDLLKRDEITRTGVYFLSGPDPAGGLTKVYIGESDEIGKRLRGYEQGSEYHQGACPLSRKPPDPGGDP